MMNYEIPIAHALVKKIKEAIYDNKSIIAMALRNGIQRDTEPIEVIITCADNIRDNVRAMTEILGEQLVIDIGRFYTSPERPLKSSLNN